MRRRRMLLVLIPVAVILFLAISAVLARVFSVDDAERAAITTLVDNEAAGNTAAMENAIYDCSSEPACRARVSADATSLRRPGAISILQLNTSSSFSLTTTVGTARVAWRAGTALPVVQCVRVRRAGNALTGERVQLLEISAKIKSTADCPRRY